MSRALTLGLAAAALAFAVLLSLLAVDVIHRDQALSDGDVRFSSGPSTTDLWAAKEILPFRPTRSLLGVDDDLEYRHAVDLFRLSRPRASVIGQFNLPPVRAEAEDAIAGAAAGEGDPQRRARLLNMLGVLALARVGADPAQSPSILSESVGVFRSALSLDPANDDAAANLELVLRIQRAAAPPRQRPGGRQQGRSSRAGNATPGSGY
jgi:hypothetical protein